MYTYKYDSIIGGLILLPLRPEISKEVRPVYFREMDILGFDKHFTYEKQDDFPYMWAEANFYFYRGRKIALTHGGTCYSAPVLEVLEGEGERLKCVDIRAMVEKNRDILNNIEIDTIKKVYSTYMKYCNKVDVFYVAFSGGKDSAVTLDIVQRALPHDAFKVVFGDTGMEFPDTYKAVDETQKWCRDNNIDFLRARSHMTPDESWRKFGPPASVLRWCCSVHKTAPQILLLREVTGKPNFTGMAFIGVRASESAARSKYEYLSRGEKHSGQYNYNVILDWNSAEVYSYIYKNGFELNEAYKKGNRQVGCLVCPGASEKNDYLAIACHKDEFEHLVSIIKQEYEPNFSSKEKLDDFIEKGGWKARKSGRDISLKVDYKQRDENGKVVLVVERPQTSWKMWIKTLGTLTKKGGDEYSIFFEGVNYDFFVTQTNEGYEVSFDERLESKAVRFVKYFKNVFRKAAACARCKECVANCHNGCISMDGGKLRF